MKQPETIVKEIIEECADCDVCRTLMDEVCLFFPELYRLWDGKITKGIEPTSEELRALVENCHFCALCPCEPVRSKIMEAKAYFVERDGLSRFSRFAENVEFLWAILGRFRKMPLIEAGWLKRFLGIHEARNLPDFKRHSFDTWAKEQGLTDPPPKGKRQPKVAYFAGCTGRFIFPEVPKSFVRIMEKLNVFVYVFEQHCCGMPALLEGDRKFAISLVSRQIDKWSELVKEGYDIVCSCPTCSFMIRKIITAGAFFHQRVQETISSKENEILVPLGNNILHDARGWISLDRKLYGPILAEQDYFTFLDPALRLNVASRTFDAGEYILGIIKRRQENLFIETEANKYSGYLYFPPCHQREQKGDKHYMELFRIFGLKDIFIFRDSFSCCGLGGIRGFSASYHDKSVEIAGKFIRNIGKFKPKGIITECLSCRIQLEHLSNYPVMHPLELLSQLMT